MQARAQRQRRSQTRSSPPRLRQSCAVRWTRRHSGLCSRPSVLRLHCTLPSHRAPMHCLAYVSCCRRVPAQHMASASRGSAAPDCQQWQCMRRFDAQRQEYVNDALGISYPVVEGVPILIARKGRVLAAADAGNHPPPPPPSHSRTHGTRTTALAFHCSNVGNADAPVAAQGRESSAPPCWRRF